MIRTCLQRFEAVPTSRILAVLALVYAASHALYFAGGVSFRADTFDDYQYLDIALLRHRLLESLLYLHSQPPLYNLFLGLVLKLFPVRYTLAFQAINMAAGVVMCLALFQTMRRLGVSQTVAFILTALFVMSPSFVLYEQWLYYTHPLAVLVTCSALGLCQYLATATRRSLALFVGALLLMCGLHGIFPIAFFVVVVGALALRKPRERKTVLAVALVPFLLLLALSVKQRVLFGTFSTSTWFGMNVAFNRIDAISLAERRQLIAEGHLSDVSLLEPFTALECYPARYWKTQPRTGIPALQEVRKSTGSPNYNNPAYIAIAKDYLKDTLYVMVHYPRKGLAGLVRGWYYYCWSSSDYFPFETAFRRSLFLSAMARCYDALFYGRLPGRHLCLFLLVAFPALVVSTVRRALSRREGGPEPDAQLLLLYLCFVVVYVAVIGNTFNATENNRIRYMTDPIYLILLGVALEQWVARFRARRVSWERRETKGT